MRKPPRRCLASEHFGAVLPEDEAFEIGAQPGEDVPLDVVGVDRFRDVERVSHQHEHLRADDGFAARARPQDVVHHRVVHLSEAMKIAVLANVPRVAGRRRDRETLDEHVVTHQRVAALIDLPRDVEAPPDVLTEGMDEEHPPVDDIVERVAGLRKLGVIEVAVVAVPGEVEPVDRLVLLFEPPFEGALAVMAEAQHVAHLRSVIRIEPHLRHALRELRLRGNVPDLERRVIAVALDAGAHEAEEVLHDVRVVEANAEPADLPVRLSLRTDAPSVERQHRGIGILAVNPCGRHIDDRI